MTAQFDSTRTPTTQLVSEAWDTVGVREILDLQGSEDEISEFEIQFEDAVYQDVIEIAMLEDVPDEEMANITALFDAEYPSEEALQEAVFTKLKKLIPDLENRLLTRVREAKAEAFQARLAGLREHLQSKPENLKVVDEAQKLLESSDISAAVARVASLRE